MLLTKLLASLKKYEVNHSYDCNNKCFIYLLSCRACSKQYIGNITNHFRSRQSNYKSDASKAESGNMEVKSPGGRGVVEKWCIGNNDKVQMN